MPYSCEGLKSSFNQERRPILDNRPHQLDIKADPLLFTPVSDADMETRKWSYSFLGPLNAATYSLRTLCAGFLPKSSTRIEEFDSSSLRISSKIGRFFPPLLSFSIICDTAPSWSQSTVNSSSLPLIC